MRRAEILLTAGVLLGGVTMATACGACAEPEDRAARERLSVPGEEAAAPGPFDWSKPREALALGSDDAARRLGSYEWSATVRWTVHRGDSAVHAIEQHVIRQAENGDFEVSLSIDPGLGKGEETGRYIIYSGRMTYARGRYAPWRERPTDRGRDARRFREESFGMLAEVANLVGPGLELVPREEASQSGRSAKRFSLRLAEGAKRAVPGAAPQYPNGGPDEDTKRRLAFLEGGVPVKAEGDLVADAQTGIPLGTRLKAIFQVEGKPDTRVELDLSAQVKSVSGIGSIEPPKTPLLDERKARGVARALETAGLKRRDGGTQTKEAAEPADEE
jgi:hypothetical protein